MKEREQEKNKTKGMIYQAFHFNYEMSDHYFMGDKYIGLDVKKELQSGELSDRINESGIDGFMNDLVKEITDVLGANTTTYDGFEFSDNNFSLYFFIDEKEYAKALNNFHNWAYAKDILKYIKYKKTKKQSIKKEEKTDKEEDNQCNCLKCEVTDVADGLKERYELKDIEALQIAIQMQQNRIYVDFLELAYYLAPQPPDDKDSEKPEKKD